MINRLVFFVLLFVTVRAENLDGVIDLHIHSDPDSMPRSIDALEICKRAQQRGLGAVVLKNHFEPTASLAWVAARQNPRLQVFGGIALNRTVGGINPAAVERMVRVKGGLGQVVWMPTFDSENQVRVSGEKRPFVSIARNGALLPEVLEVLNLIAKHNLVLATGHSSPAEILLLTREAKKLGVKKILVTHAMMAPITMTVEQMKDVAREGAFVELVCNGVLGPRASVSIAETADAIRSVGVEHCILSSDLGQPENPLHFDGLEALFAGLRKAGLSDADIKRMSRVNPAALLGLADPRE